VEHIITKTEGEIKNGQSRDMCNIEYTRHRMKINRAQNNTDNSKDEQYEPNQKNKIK